MGRRVAILILVLVALPTPAVAEDELSARDIARHLIAADDAKKQVSLSAALIARTPKATEVAAWFAEGRTYSQDAPTGWLQRKVKGLDGVERPYLLYVPEDYDPAKQYRLLLELHGGVSRAAHLTFEELQGFADMAFFWGPHAVENGYLYLLPAGQKGAEWWTDVGRDSVQQLLRTTMAIYNVDENRVCATGFSDGGSGCFYLGLACPTRFAALMPFNAHVAVAGVAGFQVHLRNLINTPMYAVNTGRDSLYPSASAKPYMDQAKAWGAPLTWLDVPDQTHAPMYLPSVRPGVWKWLQEKHRNPSPQRVVWVGAAESPSRLHWLREVTVKDVGNNAELEDFNPQIGPGRLLLGINVDRAFSGPGVKVSSVSEDSTAKAIGMRVGDVITSMDGSEIAGLDDLRAALGAKKHGDDVAVEVKRGEETKKLSGKFPEAKKRSAFTRKHTFGSIDVSRAGNRFTAKVVRVASFELMLHAGLVDLSKPIVVVVNGKTAFEGVVEPDLRFTVEQGLRDRDRTTVYTARVVVKVPLKASAD